MEREDSLDPLVVDDSADCEHFAKAVPFARNDCAGENLGSHFVAFFDGVMDIYEVTYLEVRYTFP